MFLGLQNQCKITKNYAMASAKEPNLIDPIHQFAITKLADIKIGRVGHSISHGLLFTSSFLFFAYLMPDSSTA